MPAKLIAVALAAGASTPWPMCVQTPIEPKNWAAAIAAVPVESPGKLISLLEASLFETSLLEASLLEASLLEASLLEASLLEASLLEASLFEASPPSIGPAGLPPASLPEAIDPQPEAADTVEASASAMAQSRVPTRSHEKEQSITGSARNGSLRLLKLPPRRTRERLIARLAQSDQGALCPEHAPKSAHRR
jgi:hypothetical protein